MQEMSDIHEWEGADRWNYLRRGTSYLLSEHSDEREWAILTGTMANNLKLWIMKTDRQAGNQDVSKVVGEDVVR